VGLASGSAITYTSIVSPTAPSTVPATRTAATDLSLRSTISGLDVRFVLHNAGAAGPYVLSVAPDARLQLSQDGEGAIRMTRAITDYGDDGVTPSMIKVPEYIVQPPLALDSSTDPAAPARTGPTSMTLAPTSSGQPMVTVSVDPTWLHDPARVFPVQVDVPIATAYSLANTGVFGTVNRCAPAVRAPLASVVVGVEGPCTYHGEIYFNVTSLLPDTPIQAATLRLYAPKQ